MAEDNADVVIYKIIWGLPTDGEYITVYDKYNPILNSTTNIAAKITQPTAGTGKDWIREIDFGPKGLLLGEGGNVVTNGDQITVVWDLV